VHVFNPHICDETFKPVVDFTPVSDYKIETLRRLTARVSSQRNFMDTHANNSNLHRN